MKDEMLYSSIIVKLEKQKYRITLPKEYESCKEDIYIMSDGSDTFRLFNDTKKQEDLTDEDCPFISTLNVDDKRRLCLRYYGRYIANKYGENCKLCLIGKGKYVQLIPYDCLNKYLEENNIELIDETDKKLVLARK